MIRGILLLPLMAFGKLVAEYVNLVALLGSHKIAAIQNDEETTKRKSASYFQISKFT